MSASSTLTMADAADAPGGLSAAQWRQLAGLCRWIERDDAAAQALLGPRARPCAQALRHARGVWRQRRSDAQAGSRLPPLPALRALAAAAQRLALRRRQRPAAFYAPATTAIGQGLLLRLPTLKGWLRESFAQEAVVPPGSPPEPAAERAREAVVRECLALCGAQDSYHRRRHLVQLLHEHGYREPLLRLVHRAGRDTVPKGWAEGWEQIAGIDEDSKAIDALLAAMAAAMPALDTWAQEPRPAAVAPPAAVSGRPPAPASPGQPGAVRTGQAMPVILRAAQLPRRVLWGAAGVAVLAVGAGLVLHLNRGNDAAAAGWVPFHETDGMTMSIDPASIRRDGRQLTYRVAVVRRSERSSSVAVFTTDCDTRTRRLETVQHYRGMRFETATRYEVRGTPAGDWPPLGVDVALLRAACARS